VFLGPYAVIYGHGGVRVGDNTLISMHARILSSNHAVPAVGIDIRSLPDVRQPTSIGRDVWLGAGVTVLAGVTIGDGCVVGSGAVVSHDLPPGAIAKGVPARATGWREGTNTERRDARELRLGIRDASGREHTASGG
jgi:acetyltransferase-like isoleucine patch superfamily enzyme